MSLFSKIFTSTLFAIFGQFLFNKFVEILTLIFNRNSFFSNLKKKDEACNVLFELEIKYKDAPKNVQERASSEIKKLECPEE